MKINQIGAENNFLKSNRANYRLRQADTPKSSDVATNSLQLAKGYTAISFKSGKKGHVLHVVAECPPFNKKGGVATVVGDYKKLNNVSATEKGKTVFITPFYNGLVQYACDEKASEMQKLSVQLPTVPAGLPDDHPLKNKVGQPVYIKADLSKTSIEEALKTKKDYFLLEEVASKTMSWGMEPNAEIKLLKVVSDANNKPITDDIFMVFSEATAYDPEPYSKGQYSSKVGPLERTWNGDPYAKFDKAVVEFMEDVSKKMGDFDPATVVCSDSQAAYVTHHMAKKNAEGLEYFKGKKPMQIGHNLGDGYIGITSPRNMLINLDMYSPEELKALSDSQAFRDALTLGNESEDKFISELIKINTSGKYSAMSVPSHYGKNGFLKTFGVVSTGYLDDIIANKEVAPYLYEDLKELKEKGVLIGLTNPLNTKNNAFTQINPVGYNKDHRVQFADGKTENIEALKMLPKEKMETLTLEELRDFKRGNQINFLKRFLPKYDNVKVFNSDTQDWSLEGQGTTLIRAGEVKDVSFVQTIDAQKYIDKLEKGEDVKFIVSWGRGDFQKSFDETLMAFKKYVKQTGDKNTLLVMGGDLSIDKAEGQKIKELAETLSRDPELAGRIMLMDGWSPGEAFALIGNALSAPSRTAPCELIDLEGKKMLCTPLVSNCQGLGQKNFDPSIPNELEMADAYKTTHQFFDSREELLKGASEDAKKSFNKVFEKLKIDFSKKYKTSMHKDITPEQLEIWLEHNEEYSIALRKLRDEVMSDELANCMKRCLIDDYNGEIAKKILYNQIHMQTDWEHNEKITRSDVPTGELYRTAFRKDSNIAETDVIKVKEQTFAEKAAKEAKGSFSKFLHNNKKALIITGVALAAVGTGFALFKGKKGNKVAEEKNENKSLSVVG